MDYSIVVNKGLCGKIGHACILNKECEIDGVFQDAYDLTMFQSSLDEEGIKSLNSEKIYEYYSEGKSYWSYEKTLKEAVNKSLGFWFMDEIEIPEEIPSMTIKQGFIHAIENKKEVFIFKELQLNTKEADEIQDEDLKAAAKMYDSIKKK